MSSEQAGQGRVSARFAVDVVRRMGGVKCVHVRSFTLGGGSSGAGESEEEARVSDMTGSPLARFLLRRKRCQDARRLVDTK